MYSTFDHLPAICKYANLIRCVRAYVCFLTRLVGCFFVYVCVAVGGPRVALSRLCAGMENAASIHYTHTHTHTHAYTHTRTHTRTHTHSGTLRSRLSFSTVDRSPKPDLLEARHYFYRCVCVCCV
jgi:hypothetical protein